MGRYHVIYADPPWNYRAWSGDQGRRTAESFYATMKTEELIAMREQVDEWAAPCCALFLWSTAPCLPEAVTLVSAWGFRYVTVAFTWVKVTRAGAPATGLGHYTRANAEFVLLGLRGRMPVPPSLRPNSVLVDGEAVFAPRGRHSAKPPEVALRIEGMYPGEWIERIELFARERRAGWDVWGLEATETQSG